MGEIGSTPREDAQGYWRETQASAQIASKTLVLAVGSWTTQVKVRLRQPVIMGSSYQGLARQAVGNCNYAWPKMIKSCLGRVRNAR